VAKRSAKVGEVKKQNNAEMFEARADYLNECKALSAQQKTERAEQQNNWREYNECRENNYDQIVSQSQDLSNQQGFGYGQSFNND
jgi:regulator of protease activity HflC (stomatin/prohibitin superfamily)